MTILISISSFVLPLVVVYLTTIYLIKKIKKGALDRRIAQFFKDKKNERPFQDVGFIKTAVSLIKLGVGTKF